MVRSGTCQWTETFSQSIFIPQYGASKEIEECVFKVVVAMGSHRTGILGEITINLTDYMSSHDSGSFSLPLKRCNYGTILQIRIQCLNPKRGLRDIKSSRETTSSFEGLHTNNDEMDGKSDGSDSIINQSFGSSSSNNFGVIYSEEATNRDTSFSASGSHRSSDSGDSPIGKLNFSPRNNLNGGFPSLTPAEEFSRSNPSSFNSRASGSSTPNRGQESTAQTPMSLGPNASPKAFLEIAEETIEELQDEVKMWERHSQKLKQDIEKFKKESSDKSKRQKELDMELSASYSERDSLKKEVEQLKASLEEAITKQTPIRGSKNEVTSCVEKELEDELKFLNESNANLSLQLKKSQEANLELVSILEELEETVEKQKLELEKLPQKSPANGSDCEKEAEWKAKLSAKEEEISKLEGKLSSKLNAEIPSEHESSRSHSDLIKEIEDLRDKVWELERDCAELTDENLELMYKMKKSGQDMKEKDSENSYSEIDLKSQNKMKMLEKKCADLEVELQYFKDQAPHLDISKESTRNESDIEDLKIAFSLKKKEIDVLKHEKEELELSITNIQRDKSNLEKNLASTVDSHTSTNKMLERKLMELESSKNELEIQACELEEENIQLSERVSGLEAQLRYLTNEKESNRLELEDSRSLVEDLKGEVAQQRAEIESQKGELKQKLLDAQKRLSEIQEETEYLKRSHSKLQSTMESLIEENSSLQKSNGDLRRQKLDLHERSAHLEVELSESQKRISEFLEKVKLLEIKLSSMQNDIITKEKILTSQLESICQDHEDQEERISQAKLMLNQIDGVNNVEVENLKREIAHLSSQLCSTDEEREQMASDAVLEVSGLRSDKIKLESSLQEAIAKIKMYETEIQSLRQESSKKVQGVVDLLNASKQSEEMLMSDIEHIQRQADAAKSGEEKFRKVASELELKIKASDYEKEQIMEEASSLKVQVERIAHLQDEILVLKSSLEDAKFENGKLEDLLQSVSEECEGLKTEKTSFVEKISIMQKALDDGGDDRRSRIALEEKLLRLEGDLSAKEASYAHEAELKNEINRIKRANSEYQRKIQCLEEEKCQLMRKAGMLNNENNQDKIVPDKDNDRTHDLESTIQNLESRVHALEDELTELVEANNMYKIQLQGLMEEKQNDNTKVPEKHISEGETGSQEASKISSLETELKEMRERYLHMSLQYAEVEAQREELVLKLKTTAKGKGWFS
ncbi:uncharacterized protein LOC109826962 isoform X2 [Asparagus officinalis]|nr:uncharacterized protein LOC109826962 isoform X2 [Asparagus officinalis]